MKTFFLKILGLLLLALSAGAVLADPPARVGRLAYTQGAVDLRATYDGDPTPALQNWPLTSYNVITTGPGARAELSVGSGAIRLDADSELEIAALDDTHLRLRLLQGGLNARISSPDLVQDFELDTAQGRLTLSAPSRVHVDAGRSPGLTVVNLFAGAGRFEGAQSALTLVAGQRAEVTDDGMRIGVATRDDFDIWSLARDQRDNRSVSARYVSPDTTGYEDLDQYGSWSMTADYGAVWYPNAVPADWAPYQSGLWAWIEPWGWTWIDSAPWGYAPFHYGRWAWFNRRWCWVPGRIAARPVWAPALVGWVGGHNWSTTFSIGSAPAVGWFPLAPHEAFRPSYVVSPTYVRQINITQVTNVNNIVNLPPQTNFQNRFVHNALTVIPHERFQGRRTVTVANAPALVEPQQLAKAPLSATVPAIIARPAPLTVPRVPDNDRRHDLQRPNERPFPTRPDTQHQQPAPQPPAHAAVAPLAPIAPLAPPARAPSAEPAPLTVPRVPDNDRRHDLQRPNERPFPVRPDTQHQQPAPQPPARAAIAPMAPMPIAPVAPARAPGAEPAPHRFTAPAEWHIQRSEPPVQPAAPLHSSREAPPAALPVPVTPRHEERAQARIETQPRAMPEQRQPQAPARIERRIEANPAAAPLAMPRAPNVPRAESHPQPRRQGEAQDGRDTNRPTGNER